MTRADFERHQAAQLGRTVSELRAQGYHSGPCSDEECGWLALAAPPGDEAEAERITLCAEARGVPRSEFLPFGSVEKGDCNA